MSKTRLLTPVTRWIFIGHKEYAMTIDNDLTICFREHGRKTSFTVPLDACYNLAVIHTGRKQKQEKLAKQKARVGLGKNVKTRKQTDPAIFFDKSYAQALAKK